ncbi:MAG: sensor domain-containing diguanylate cyclase [Treponema sp.]|nr:sensor domain-containing diguanylate cyclase [Treponema sp.]
MKRKILSVIIIILIAIIFMLEIPDLLVNKEQKQFKNRLIASHIYDSINTNISKSLVVSESIACDTLIKQTLIEESHSTTHVTEQKLKEYLTSIKENFGYTVAFVISEKTHCYYTPYGIGKIVNPQEEPYDIWYKIFVDSDKRVDLDTDRDQLNDFRWTIFINIKICDADGKLLGVAGVGLFMDDLQNIMLKAENDYDVKVNLIDNDGLVQVDTDPSNIENAYISDAIADNADANDFTYTGRRIGGFRMTRYLPTLDWYLVVQSFNIDSSQISIKFSIATTFALLFLLLVIIVTIKPDKILSSHKDFINLSVPEDPLTGLPNRNYLKDAYGEDGVFNTVRYKSLAMFDIDRFKSISETRDGNMLLKEIVKLSKKIIGEQEIMFRWSGDEFVFFLEIDIQAAEEKFKTLCESVKESLSVTLSVGIVEVDLAASIKTNYHRAVQQCYIVKESGGNGVKVKA